MQMFAKPEFPASVMQPIQGGLGASISSSSQNRLIFVDDDDIYRDIVAAELADEGFRVSAFADGASMLLSLEAGLEADIVILDIGLGTASGIDLLSQLRERNVALPVVFLTGRNSPTHERLALQRGAVDFIDKGRGTSILASRLRLIVQNKRQVPVREQMFQCGRLVLKPTTGRAYWDDVDVNLTLSEYKIVHLLASNVGGYVPYRQIYDAMHYVGFIAGSGEHGYRTNVRSSIKRIRNKFRQSCPDFDEISNYNGFGYCWGMRRDKIA